MGIHVAAFFLLIFCTNFGCHITLTNATSADVKQEETKVVVTEKIYTNVFKRRREEQQGLIKHIFSATESYEKRFKLLEIGFEKILAVVEESKATLKAENYVPVDFPKTDSAIDALALVLENTALLVEMFLRQPAISYKVMAQQRPDWKAIVNWAISFCGNYINTIIDERTTEMLAIFALEMHPEHRPANFANPYIVNDVAFDAKTKQPAGRKKSPPPKRGPRLRAGGTKVDEL